MEDWFLKIVAQIFLGNVHLTVRVNKWYKDTCTPFSV